MSEMRERAHGKSIRLIWANAAAFVLVLLTASMLLGSSAGANAGAHTTVETGSTFDITGCDRVGTGSAVAMVQGDGGCETPASCPPSGGDCCGTACHSMASQAEGFRLAPPAAPANAERSALRLTILALTPGMFRPPIV